MTQSGQCAFIATKRFYQTATALAPACHKPLGLCDLCRVESVRQVEQDLRAAEIVRSHARFAFLQARHESRVMLNRHKSSIVSSEFDLM